MSTPDPIRWLRQPVFLKYGTATLSVVAALFVAQWMQIQYDFQPLTPFLCAIMFSAWLGGLTPGLLAVALSLLAFQHYFLSSLNSMDVEREIPRLLLAGATALFIMWLTATQRSATEALRESELRLRQIAENIREVFWMATRALDEPLYVSPAYESIWGRSVQSLRQQPRSFFDAIHVEDREHAAGIIRGQREQEIDIEYRIVRPDGAPRWIRDRRFPVKDASGNVYRVAGVAEDITERKNAEEALWRSEQKLREREELYRILTENANDFIRVHELDGRSIYASPSVVRLFGQEPAHIFQFAYLEDLAICRQWWEQVLAEGRETLVWRVRVRDSGSRWMETQGTVVQYRGQPRVMTVCRDVTEWKKAEEALRESEQRYLSLFENMAEAVVYLRMLFENGEPRDAIYLEVNPAWEKFTGLKSVVGRKISEVIPGIRAASPIFFERAGRVAMTGQCERFEIYAAPMKKWLSIAAYCPQKEHVIVVMDDITERKQAQEHLRLVLDTTPGLIYTSRPDGYLDYFNQRWLKYAGLSMEDAQGWGWTATIHPEDVEEAVNGWRASLASGEPFQNESRVRRADGVYRWMLHRKVPLRDEHGNVVKWYGLSIDIEDRKRAEHALQEAASQLEALSRRLVALQEFERKELARELHDRIGQSLTALNINLKILATTLPQQASDQLRARLADSEALVESTTAAIRNVMSELRPPMLDDQGLVAALDWYAQQFSARTGISVAVRDLQSAERPMPEMEIALFRVAQEALNNVVKHARASRVEITLGRVRSEYVMTVEDDGVGFDAAEDSAARQAGLGMVTMRERTQALGGILEVRAGRGDGTRLTVRVPA
jgi:PAS domain S-box-containing protein